MKKNLLSLGAVIILIVLLVCLTGCGNKENNTNTNVQKENLNEDTISTNTTGIEIKEVIEKFDNGLALVEDKNQYQYVIDESGKVIYENENKQEVSVSNGYISVGNYIYDDKGMVIAQSETKVYGNVSESNYVSVQIKTEDVSGTKTLVQIEDLKGNKITDFSQSYSGSQVINDIKYLFGDFYTVYDRESEEHLLINARNNEIKKMNEILDGFKNSFESLYIIEQDGNWYYAGANSKYWFINSDFSKVISNKQYYNDDEYECSKVILDKYLIGNGNKSNTSDKIVAFDLEGNMVKDFTEIGKIKSITDYNNIIYVISETGYIYTMDEKFNYIVQPTKTQYENLLKTDDGIWATKGKNIYLLNDKLEQGKELTDISFTLVEPFAISDDINFIYSSSEGKYHDVYNIETGKLLEIYR